MGALRGDTWCTVANKHVALTNQNGDENFKKHSDHVRSNYSNSEQDRK